MRSNIRSLPPISKLTPQQVLFWYFYMKKHPVGTPSDELEIELLLPILRLGRQI